MKPWLVWLSAWGAGLPAVRPAVPRGRVGEVSPPGWAGDRHGNVAAVTQHGAERCPRGLAARRDGQGRAVCSVPALPGREAAGRRAPASAEAAGSSLDRGGDALSAGEAGA